MSGQLAGAAKPLDAAQPDGGFRDGLARGELLIAGCAACNVILDYSQRYCTSCGSGELSWRVASGRAQLRCIVEISVSYTLELPAPFLVASVQLEEGPHLLARYDGDLERSDGGSQLVADIANGQLRFRPA